MIWRLDSDNPHVFPDPEWADPDGLVAIGGDLSPERLLAAYSLGIFPWYGEQSPPLWWSPDPRCVILPENFRVPHTVRRELKKSPFAITINQAFEDVINGCAHMSRKQKGEMAGESWLVDEMRTAYIHLHKLGFACSVEAWDDQGLAGGLYGVSLGRIFFGESMFHIRSNASKLALVVFLSHLWKQGFQMVDCQMETPHILRYGARNLPRSEFLRRLKQCLHGNDRS